MPTTTSYSPKVKSFMIFFTLKIVIAAIIIAFASWLSGQNPKLAGFIIDLPLSFKFSI